VGTRLKNYLAFKYWRGARVVEWGGLATAFSGVPPKPFIK